ncbi:hypothetical protein Gohar_009049, partial [Gossypium harknessii]|nr:hypothetical protein [Gossypium harknessii]
KISYSWAQLYEWNHYGDKSNLHISNSLSTLSENWIHLFTYRVVDRGSRAAFASGVLLDHNGNWIFGFNRFLEICNIFVAELCGILGGMTTSLSNSFNRVMIHIDNLEVLQTLQDNLLGDLCIKISKESKKYEHRKALADSTCSQRRQSCCGLFD